VIEAPKSGTSGRCLRCRRPAKASLLDQNRNGQPVNCLATEAASNTVRGVIGISMFHVGATISVFVNHRSRL